MNHLQIIPSGEHYPSYSYNTRQKTAIEGSFTTFECWQSEPVDVHLYQRSSLVDSKPTADGHRTDGPALRTTSP